jgi:hypothetical protein
MINSVEENKTNEVFFMICQSCFWCASCLSIEKSLYRICPSCKDKIESMPITKPASMINLPLKYYKERLHIGHVLKSSPRIRVFHILTFLL